MLAEGITIGSGIVITAITALCGAVALLWRNSVVNGQREIARLEADKATILADKYKAIDDLESAKKSFERVATEAVEAATNIYNYLRAKEGKPPLLPIAPVVTESNSPSTAKQRDAALLETFKARITAIKLATKQKPRPEPERGNGHKSNKNKHENKHH